jgi:serine/threonine protein kinase
LPPDSLIDRAIEAVADGAPVDWDMLDSQAPDDERELLKCLRILDGISELHRSTQDEVDPAEDSLDERSAKESPPKESPPKESIARSSVTGLVAMTEDRSDWWGRYRLIERVGEGSFGNVYRAWDPELEREIAIKILHRRVADSHLKERLLREGRALARVRDHNVVSVFGIESHGDRVGLCMEFVPGETLEAVLGTQGPLSAQEAVLVGEDVCRALAAVHGAGFVHRDVKARNVMREQTGRIVLMDFGTGREAEDLKEAGPTGIAGTPMYMAPEVLAGLPASESSDVYSTGVLLYYLVTSEYPVEGRTLEELRAAHMQGRRRLLSDRRSDLPLPFIQLVDRALSPDPDQRYTSATTLLEALERFSNPLAPRPLGRYLLVAGLTILGAAGLMTGLGLLSSQLFNLALGRSGFASESVLDWFKWGAKSCLAPAVVLLIAMLAIGLLIVLRNVVLTASEKARGLESAARLRLVRAMHRLHLDQVSVLASCVVLLSTIALLSAWWAFYPLFDTYGQKISAMRVEDLALRAPDYHWYHVDYRKAFISIVILSVMAWYPVTRLAAIRGERLSRGMVAGGAAVVLLGLVLLDLPYRMLYHNQFDAVTWNGVYCYNIGERQDDLLLFCPDLQPPRNRIVSKQTNLTPTGVTESIFTRFSKQPGAPGPGTH